MRPPGRAGTRTAAAILLALLVLLSAHRQAAGLPYQLLDSPSAVLLRKGGQEIKLDYAEEVDRNPAETWLLHYRYGLTRWMEVSGGALHAQYSDRDIARIAELQVTAKFRLPWKVLRSVLVAYLRLRESLGDPVIVEFLDDSGKLKSSVSRHADGGRDAAVGILGRRPAKPYDLNYGIEYTHAGKRGYGDFAEDQTAVYTLYFSPERHFFRNTLMVALENRYTYWTNRGDYYDLLPQVRWEFVRNWVVETGVSIPVIGGRMYRYIFGFTYQF